MMVLGGTLARTNAFRVVYRFELFLLRKNQQFHTDLNFYSFQIQLSFPMTT